MIAAPAWREPAARAVSWRSACADDYILDSLFAIDREAAVVGIFQRNNRDSALIIFPAVEDGLAHAVGVLGSLVLALADVDVGDDFLPACLYVQFGEFLLVIGLFAQVVLRPLHFFLLLAGEVLLELPFPLLAAFLLIVPLPFLHSDHLTLFSFSMF